MVEIVAVLIAAGDGEHADAQNVGDAMRQQVRITRIRDQGRQLVGEAEALFGRGQQQHATVGCQAPAIECGDNFLARHGWEMERDEGNIV